MNNQRTVADPLECPTLNTHFWSSQIHARYSRGLYKVITVKKLAQYHSNEARFALQLLCIEHCNDNCIRLSFHSFQYLSNPWKADTRYSV